VVRGAAAGRLRGAIRGRWPDLPLVHELRHGAGIITLLMIPPVPDHPDLLFLLHDIARQLRVSGDRRARAHGMTRAQWVILWWLERQPGLSQKELAEIMDVEPITVARLVDRLAGRGMVERRDDPADRRVWRLHLLAPAFPVLEQMRGVRDQVASVLADGVAPEALETVRQTLIAMKANIVADLRQRPADYATAPVHVAPLLPVQLLPVQPLPVQSQPVQSQPVQPRVGARRSGARTAATVAEPVFQQDRP